MKNKKFIFFILCAALLISIITFKYSPKNNSNKSTQKIKDSETAQVNSNKDISAAKSSDTSNISSTSAANDTSSLKKIDITMINTHPNNMGNTSINLSNGGQLGLQGKWMYFTQPTLNSFGMSKNIYRAMLDGETGLKVLYEGKGIRNINIVGEWIYFTDEENLNSIYKVKTDGTEKQAIVNESAHYMTVVDNYIYYNSPTSLRRVNTDGSNNIILIDKPLYDNFIIYDRHIYYIERVFQEHFTKETSAICRASLDGSNPVKLINGTTNTITIYDGWIYYISVSDTAAPLGNNSSLCRAKLDGSSKTKLIDKIVNNYTIADGYIYLVLNTSLSNIYKSKLDGTELKRLTNNIDAIYSSSNQTQYIEKLYSVQDSIFAVINNFGKLAYYRVKTDGSFDKIIN